MYKRFTIIIFLIIFGVIIAGCSSLDNKTITQSSSFENDINTLIKNNLQGYKTESLKIGNIANVDSSTFVEFMVNNDKLNEGLAYIEKEDNSYKLIDIDITEADLKTPFTRHMLGIALKDGRNCRLIGGYINNNDIKEIHFEYKDNTLKVIKIGSDQKSFLEYIIGDVDSLKYIIGYDENGNVVYSFK